MTVFHFGIFFFFFTPQRNWLALIVSHTESDAYSLLLATVLDYRFADAMKVA